MKNTIAILCLLSINSILISQDQKIKNISDLSEILYSDSLKSFLSAEERKNYERNYSFLTSRYDDSGTIAGYQKSVQKYYESIKASDKKSFSILESESNLVWAYLGPIGLNTNNSDNSNRGAIGRGWIETIYVIDPDTIYAGARNSGLWYTKNAGDSWKNISESEPLINGILSILIDPEDSQHILVLTGSQTASYLNTYSNGIFETFNHGVSWTRINTNYSGEDIFNGSHNKLQAVKIVNHPESFEDLFLVTETTLYRRQYASNNWELIYQSPFWSIDLFDLAFDLENSNVFFLGGSFTFKCLINGSYIQMINITEDISAGLEDTLQKCVIGINENYPDNIWFYYKKLDNSNHISKYDGTYKYCKNVPGGYLTMNIFPSSENENIVYFGELPMYKYDDDPSTKTFVAISSSSFSNTEQADDITDFLHSDIRHIQVIEVAGKDRVYVGHDGGVAWGEYIDTTWSPKYSWHQISDDGTEGLQTNEFYGISISKSNPIVVAGGTQDCASFLWKEETLEWVHFSGGDGMEGAIDPNNPSIIVAGSFPGYDFNYKRHNIANINSPVTLLSLLTSTSSCFNRVIQHPAEDNTIFVGSGEIYKISNCYTGTKSQLTIPVPSQVDKGVSAFAICYNDTEIIYVAEILTSTSSYNSDHMWRYSPSSSSWIDIGQNLAEYTNSYAKDIVVNPENDMEVWVCMGQAVNEDRKVFHTVNGGSTWTSLSLGYPENIPANRLLYDFVTGKLYVATDVGIFFWNTYKPENGWSAITGTLPFKLVTDIEIDYLKPRLIAGTYGRGIWQAELPESNCYDETPLIVTSSQTWSADEVICQSIKVQNYSTLTITGNITLSEAATITVEGYCSLVINSGTLINGNIIVKPYGSLTIMNNGIVQLNENDNVNCELGSVFHFNEGGVETLTD